jgi:hypothetical protein
VERARLTPQGYADDKPVAPNTNEAGRAQNRRVQIQITANQQLQQQAAAPPPVPPRLNPFRPRTGSVRASVGEGATSG